MELTKPFEQLTYSLTMTCAAEIFQDLYQKIDTLISLQRRVQFKIYLDFRFFFPCYYSVPLLEYIATWSHGIHVNMSAMGETNGKLR